MHFAFQGLDDGIGEIDALELTGAAEPTRAKHVDLHQLAAHNIEPDKEHAVFDKFGADDFRDVQGDIIDYSFRLFVTCTGFTVCL